jgi:CheY-like chemotaxis protein
MSGSPDQGDVVRRILVAEDSKLIQGAVRDLLERWGHEVEVVDDGRAALEAVTAVVFDVVLMDLNMPGLDGVQATEAIRSLERASPRPRTTIIALSASPGQRTRCIEAGMDAFLSKPIDRDALHRTLADLGVAGADVDPAEPSPAETGDDGGFDWPAFVALVGDAPSAERLMETFLTVDLPRLAGNLARAVETSDATGIDDAAHGLKGAFAELGAEAARAASAELERLGKANDLTGVPEAYAILVRAVERVKHVYASR